LWANANRSPIGLQFTANSLQIPEKFFRTPVESRERGGHPRFLHAHHDVVR
jgi:hypothetical protein